MDPRIRLYNKVYHREIYDGRELMKIIGIRVNEVELEGDYSGGTHNVCQKDWLNIEGIVFPEDMPKIESLKPGQLMLKNWVSVFGQYLQVLTLSHGLIHTVCTRDYTTRHAFPILLSSDLLKKSILGDTLCVQIDENTFLCYEKDNIVLHIEYSDGLARRTILHHIKYLHQVQNLYFCLTGKDFEITL